MPARFSAFGRVFSPSWPMTLATLVLLGVFLTLGRWQWQRGEAKQVLWSQFENAPMPETSATTPDFDSLPRYSRVAFPGRFDASRQFLIENRPYQGRPGYEVLTLVRAGNGERLLVNRGWVPFTGYREQLPDVSMNDGEVTTISGRVDELPTAGLESGRAAPAGGDTWPKVTSFPSHEQLQAALGETISRRIVLLDPKTPQGYMRNWKPPGMEPGRHFSYAIQWWGFAVVLLVLYFALNFRRVS
jgi:cytochrome oxidase assembly protein ShyY1